ncbi:4-alpha-L-fucosyltransferase [Mannheimia granulomatis]|uniref:4-alpha-L-fucosyltransferase n=1 Tax=Mannheimia granulomatis TaxID=85402 RepID=A0A6G8JKV4_9PAST|nr:TDP-N-acetylfucosamine:lipid II N-acetylfucosaminyltransferase [Mannheimia granulomatis]QIM67790.1 4-alpha-L-fucosyltransferase [Mannheimia granulomatis]
MLPTYHILGSDIPHHNQRVLSFFQHTLLPQLANQSHYFYVVGGKQLETAFSSLSLNVFASQFLLAKALIAKIRQNPTACFILHGQFNPWIWLAIALGIMPSQNLIWHIWGADLYEAANSWKFKLFYPIRRLAQKKLKKVWATMGDLDYLWRNVRKRTEKDLLIYFPTKLPSSTLPIMPKTERLTILLGNSGDPSNNHIAALSEIRQIFGDKPHIIIPMGYPTNNECYIHQVEQHGKRLFSTENLQILRHKLDFADYLAILTACDLGYFNFERQQGIGTICLLIQHNIPCVLHPSNPFCLDMQAENLPYLTTAKITQAEIQSAKKILETTDKAKITFFPPTYIKLWQQRLNELTEP